MPMLIRSEGVKYILPREHPYATSILALVKAYAANKRPNGDSGKPPERNDVKQLWRELRGKHKKLLRYLATHAGGTTQSELETALKSDWQGLRGVHNGLARICERLEIEKPVRATGYNSSNRMYHMDPDAAHTIRKLVQRDKKDV